MSVSIPALHLTSDGALRRRLNRLSEPVRQGLPPRRSLECAAICKQVQTCRLGVQSACTSSNSQCTRPQITATLEIILHSTPRQEMPDVQMAVDKNISGPSPTLAGMRRSVGYESKRDVSREPTLMPTTREPSTKSVPRGQKRSQYLGCPPNTARSCGYITRTRTEGCTGPALSCRVAHRPACCRMEKACRMEKWVAHGP